MTVVSAKEIHLGRGGGDESNNTRSTATDTRVYRIITDDAADDTTTILGACDTLGTVHPNNPYLFLKRRRCENESFSKKVWLVSLDYSNDLEQSENPLHELPALTWGSETVQEVISYDINDEAILNSAGDWYEDGVTEPVVYPTLKIAKKLAAVPSWILSYANAINSDSFVVDGIAVGQYQAKMGGINIGSWAQKNNVWYRPVDITLRFRSTWIKYVLDQGLYRIVEVDVGSYDKVKCVAEDGTDVTKPVLLDGSGGQLDNPSPSTAVFNSHEIWPEYSFSSLLYFLFESYG